MAKSRSLLSFHVKIAAERPSIGKLTAVRGGEGERRFTSSLLHKLQVAGDNVEIKRIIHLYFLKFMPLLKANNFPVRIFTKTKKLTEYVHFLQLFLEIDWLKILLTKQLGD